MRTTPLLRIAIAVLLAAALGCKSLPEKQPIPASPIQFSSNEWRVTDQVIVITDASGTQYVNETFPDAKALTQSFVAAMPNANAPAASPGYSAGSIGFGGDDRDIAPYGAFDRQSLASQASRLEVMGDINGMGGKTPLHDVLAEARASLKGKSGRAALVIFSDGLPDDEDLSILAAYQLVKSYPGDVCIHTVQTGTDPEGTAFLTRLSKLTSCGSVRNGAEITSGYEVQQFARAVFVGAAQLPAVAASPCTGEVRLRGIEFDFDKATIKGNSSAILDVAVDELKKCPNIQIQITGHTDAIGSAEYNEGLSLRRARATKDYFVRSGISGGRLATNGVGESDPVASNDTPDGRAQNRRVVLTPLR